MTENVSKNWVWGPLSFVGLICAVVTFLLDQAHKYWMLYSFWPQQGCYPFNNVRVNASCYYEVTSFLNFLMIWNPGISYGLFPQEGPLGRLFLILVALIAVVILTIWLSRVFSVSMALSLGLIIGGALGNALDRYLYGAVADFFSLHYAGYYWYVFNIADMAIVVGVIGLLYNSFTESPKKVSNSA